MNFDAKEQFLGDLHHAGISPCYVRDHNGKSTVRLSREMVESTEDRRLADEIFWRCGYSGRDLTWTFDIDDVLGVYEDLGLATVHRQQGNKEGNPK